MKPWVAVRPESKISFIRRPARGQSKVEHGHKAALTWRNLVVALLLIRALAKRETNRGKRIINTSNRIGLKCVISSPIITAVSTSQSHGDNAVAMRPPSGNPLARD